MSNDLVVKREYIKETLALKKRMESSYLELGERLQRIRDERLYEPDFENFASFCWEAKLAESTASRLISVYQKFVVEYGINKDKLSSLGWTNLYVMLPLATDKNKAKELVEDSISLRREDILEKVREETKGKNCEHDWYEVRIKQCRNCGAREKLYE